MTPRYRCPGCGSYTGTAFAVWSHMLKAHRERLIQGLGLIETFTTRKMLDPPRNALNPHPRTEPDTRARMNPGVSGEGDS